VGAEELRILEWVRAFVGDPALVLLECPELQVAKARRAALGDFVVGARKAGAAVLWLTESGSTWANVGESATQRWRLSDGCLTPERSG
jgi:hypothetical protein